MLCPTNVLVNKNFQKNNFRYKNIITTTLLYSVTHKVFLRMTYDTFDQYNFQSKQIHQQKLKIDELRSIAKRTQNDDDWNLVSKEYFHLVGLIQEWQDKNPEREKPRDIAAPRFFNAS